MKKSIIIVEDHEEMQALYEVMFRREKQVEVVALVPDTETAFKKIKDSNPDLIILDISLPGMSGIEFTKIIRNEFPAIKILVVTGHEPELYYDDAKAAGADELIMKGDVHEIIIEVKKLLFKDQ